MIDDLITIILLFMYIRQLFQPSIISLINYDYRLFNSINKLDYLIV